MTVVVGDAGRDVPRGRSADAGRDAFPADVRPRPDDPGPPPGGTDDPTRAAILVSTSVIGLVRLFAGVLAVPGLFAAPDAGRSAAGLGLVVLMAAALTLRPGPLTATPVRRAALLTTDLAVGGAVLAVAGFGIPCLYQSLGTAALAASLYGAQGVAVGAALGMAASVITAWTLPFDLTGPAPLGVVIAIPTAYALVALVAVLVRHLHREQLVLRQSLRDATWRAAQAQERARLARELHDSLASTLSGIGLCARAVRQDSARPDRVEELAGDIAAAADEAAVQARAMISGLRGPVSPDLAGTVRATVAAWSRSCPVAVETQLRVDAEPDPDTGRELVAVLDEALVNVRRHAGASRVQVELTASDRRVRLSVRDDGHGFAVPADMGALPRTGRYGLLGMTERLDGLGGELAVRSRPGLGTTVVAEVPLRS